MSYVQANTGNPLGRRGLGRLRGPSGPDGAITYRIDPRTGQYQFYRTDIKPRGVFLQNTFQHPAPPVMSALGTRVLPIGKSVTGSTLQRGRVSQEPMISLRPGVTLSGLGCGSCGGRCNTPLNGFFPRRRRGMRGLGDIPADTHIDSNGCIVDSDGVVLQCPNAAGVQAPTQTFPTVSVVPTQVADVVQAFLNVGTAQRPPVTQPQTTNWFSQSSLVGGAAIPNSFLAIGGALFAALAMEGSKGRRR